MTKWILTISAVILFLFWLGRKRRGEASVKTLTDEYGACNGRTVDAIVAGTGFEGRAETIRNFVADNMTVILNRDPGNEHDSNAIEVLIPVGQNRGLAHIGFIKKKRAASLSKLIDSGITVKATVKSFYAPEDMEFPRVSLTICIEDTHS